MSKEWEEELTKALENFVDVYRINYYKSLMIELKKNSTKGDLFLMIFAMVYKIKIDNLKAKENMEKEQKIKCWWTRKAL